MANLRESENVLQYCKYQFEGVENGKQKDTLFAGHPVYVFILKCWSSTDIAAISIRSLLHLF